MRKLLGIAVCAIILFAQPAFVALAAPHSEPVDEAAQSFYGPNEVDPQWPLVLAQNEKSEKSESEVKKDDDYDDEYEDDVPLKTISDPIEGFNRGMFSLNDGLYFYFFKPIGQGIKFILPEPVRVAVRNFFYNLRFPIRFFNCLFQLKFEGAGSEFVRFLINSTAGLAGFFDIASKAGIKNYNEDFGQTLGYWGLGNGFYLNIPFFGPSSARDGIGLIADGFMWPPAYLDEFWYAVVIRLVEALNNVSLTIGEYEALKEAALDPYVAVRDAYYQYRETRIKE